MLRNQDSQRPRNAYTTLQGGSPPPTLACPSCPRHFHSKGGRRKHIQAKHYANGLDPHASNLTLPPLPVLSSSSSTSAHSVQFQQPPSPIPSDYYAQSPPSHGEAADKVSDIGIDHADLEYPHFDSDRDSAPPGPDPNVGVESNDNPIEQHAPNVQHITYIYHPKLNGK